MTAFLVISGAVILIATLAYVAVAKATSPAPTDEYWEPVYDAPLFGPTGNVRQLSQQQVEDIRIKKGLRRLMQDIHQAQAEVDDIRITGKQEDAYTKKLRLNADHEQELRTRKPLTPAQVEAQAAAASKHYWSNRDSILQKRKEARIAAAIAAGRKPRIHATYIKQDDNPYPVHSPEYQQFAREKRQKFHEQKHAVAALTPARLLKPGPVLAYSSHTATTYPYGQRALA